MKTSKNRLTLDYADLPDLKAALGGLSPGDRCTVEFELMVTANDDGSITGDIEGVCYDCEEEDSKEADSEGSAEPTTEEPVMVVISKRNTSGKKKKPDSSSEDSDEGDEEV
jgi:hypothetical protein